MLLRNEISLWKKIESNTYHYTQKVNSWWIKKIKSSEESILKIYVSSWDTVNKKQMHTLLKTV